MRRALIAILLLAAALVAAAPASAERLALLISAAVYPGGEARGDAKASIGLVAESLAQQDYKVRLVADRPIEAIAAALKEFAVGLDKPGAEGLVYFIGGGVRIGADDFLFARDFGPDDASQADAASKSLASLLEPLRAAQGIWLAVADAAPPRQDGNAPAGSWMPFGGFASGVLGGLVNAIVFRSDAPSGTGASPLARSLAGDAATAKGNLLMLAFQLPLDLGSGNEVSRTSFDAADGSNLFAEEEHKTQAASVPELSEAPAETSEPGQEASAPGTPDREPAASGDLFKSMEEDILALQGPGGGGGQQNVSDFQGTEEEAFFREASRIGTARAFYIFLTHYPNGELAQVARNRMLELDPSVVPPPPAQPAGSENGQPSPPPPPVAPEGQAAEAVTRHPSLDAPDEVVAGKAFTISVALTQEQLTPEAVASPAPGTTLSGEGALQLNLPSGNEEWPVDIDLFAPGFDLADDGEWSRRVTLYRQGDSDFARFKVKARAMKGAARQKQLMVRFYSAGQFLGSAARPVMVFASPDEMQAAHQPAPSAALRAAPMLGQAPPTLATGDVSLVAGLEVPDLDVTIHYDDPDRLGHGLIMIHSPHMAGPVTEEFDTPADLPQWLNSRYAELVEAGMRVRGATSLTATAKPLDPAAQRRFATKLAEGFGSELYRNFVPDAFRKVFWSLKDAGELQSIQITSNSPLMPWEIVRPEREDGASGGFLGLDYRLARWTPRSASGQVDRPLARLPFTGVAAVAPAYDGNRELPFQQIEVDALSKLSGFRLVGGDFSSFEKLVGEVSTGFIHFSGHGEISDPGTGAPVFAIQLLDQALDPGTWRALDFAPRDRGNPFYFFNACDTGRARSLAGFVQGWGPAVLSSGASGFIGGMWPLADRTAADFSTSFYDEIAARIPSGPVYLAQVLQDVRRKFYATGDPTYLAYTFYGNANLQVVAQ